MPQLHYRRYFWHTYTPLAAVCCKKELQLWRKVAMVLAIECYSKDTVALLHPFNVIRDTERH